MRKATRRLRGSFSPSIIWMKPKVKSAPRPFSSGEERTRSLLFLRTGSWIFYWPVFSLYYHCLLFLASQREPGLFSYSKRSSVKKRYATIYNCYRGTNLKHQPKFYPSFTLLGSEWILSFPLSFSLRAFNPKAKMTPGTGEKERMCSVFRCLRQLLTFVPGSHEVADDTVDSVSVHL